MPLHTFVPNTYARAEEVNDNFAFLLSLIGEDTTPDDTVSNGGYTFGPRRTSKLTAEQDTGSLANSHAQLMWNSSWTSSGGVWSFNRIIQNSNATALRIGADGFTVKTTGMTTGNLNSQMQNAFHIAPTTGVSSGGYISVPTDWSFQHYDGVARNIQDYRLMYVPMSAPPAIYANARISSAAVRVLKATDYGVPTSAKAISIFAYVTATNASGAGFKMYEERTDRHQRHGFTVHASVGMGSGGVRLGQRAGGWGVVPLGVGSYSSKFVIETTAAFELANVYITGFWL